MPLRAILFGLVALAAAGPAQAHFVWAEFVAIPQEPLQLRLTFGETVGPGEPRLLEKIANSKAWVRSADGAATPATLAMRLDSGAGALVGDSPTPRPLSFEATFDYGIFARGPSPTHLIYYAKSLADAWQASGAVGAAPDLKLDIAPSLVEGRLQLLVRFDGQPDAEREVIVAAPAGARHELKTDAQGRASVDAAPGAYAIRAAHIDRGASGELAGRSFGSTSHYATLTLRVSEEKPAASASASSASAGDALSAQETLRQARLARAVWDKFPGYTADVTVSQAGVELSGKIAMDSSGSVTVDLPDGPERKWVETQLASLAQHRMPDGEIGSGDVRFADEDRSHPLGRRIDLGDPKLGSVYRIRDNVIYEVNRNAGPMRFTITVLDVVWNAEHKYLPRVFVMSFFDAATGELKRSAAHVNEWERVGDFDLPSRILEIDAGAKASPARQMAFKNLKLAR